MRYCVFGWWCAQQRVVGTVHKVLLPVYAQEVVLAFDLLVGPRGVLWWLCTCPGCTVVCFWLVVWPTVLLGVWHLAVAGACTSGGATCFQSTVWTTWSVVVAVRTYRMLLWCAAACFWLILLG